jgi:hypothetical protein
MVVATFVGVLFWGSRPGSIAEYVEDAGAPVTQNTASDATFTEPTPTPTLVTVSDAGIAAPDAKPIKTVRPVIDKNPRGKPPALTIKVFDAGVVALAHDAAVKTPIAPKEPARLIVDIKPWCVVHIDGKKYERASATRVISIAEGTHKVECKQEQTGLSWTKNVTLRAGEQRTLKGTVLADITVKIRLTNAKSVQISGRTVSNGSRITLPAARHRVEIIRNGKVNGKPSYINMRQDCTLRDKGKLACSAE